MRSFSYVLLILGCFATDMVSDIYLRAHHIAGVDPLSWDVMTMGCAGVGIALLIFDRHKS